MSEKPLVLTQQQVADMLQVEPRTVRRLGERGKLRVTYVGRLPRYYPEDVRRYLSERERVA